jgi:preprotein translocase subunit SecA
LILCQHNAARRIDRQFVGRSARQGNPGSAETFIALDQPLISRFAPRFLLRFNARNGIFAPAWIVGVLIRLPQLLEERRQRAERRALLEQDARSDRHLVIGAAE